MGVVGGDVLLIVALVLGFLQCVWNNYHSRNTMSVSVIIPCLCFMCAVVVLQNEICRGALCENQHWSAVVTLFGLLGCSIAITLKRELLLTLAAVSRTPMIAATVWQTLEASQVPQSVLLIVIKIMYRFSMAPFPVEACSKCLTNYYKKNSTDLYI